MSIVKFLATQKESTVVAGWAIANVTERGSPVSYRYRKTLPPHVSTTNQPFLLTLDCRELKDDSNGLPIQAEILDAPNTPNTKPKLLTEQQLALFDALEQLNADNVGTLMITAMRSDSIEWYWYTNDPQTWLAQFKQHLSELPTLPVEVRQARDEDWQTWRNLSQGNYKF